MSAGIKPATFRFVVQHLNHCATAVPLVHLVGFVIRINIFIQLGEGNCSNIEVKSFFSNIVH